MIRMIIADDHSMFRQGLQRLLQEADDISVVAECTDGHMALEMVRSLTPDVAVLDVTMPWIDGISACRKITQERLGTRVIILTMHADSTIREQATAAGAAAVVLKDAPFERLLSAIREVAGSAQPANSAPARLSAQPAQLTEREIQILQLVARGCTNRMISEEFAISIKTVDSHRTNLMKKLKLHSTAELVRYAFQTGIA